MAVERVPEAADPLLTALPRQRLPGVDPIPSGA